LFHNTWINHVTYSINSNGCFCNLCSIFGIFGKRGERGREREREGDIGRGRGRGRERGRERENRDLRESVSIGFFFLIVNSFLHYDEVRSKKNIKYEANAQSKFIIVIPGLKNLLDSNWTISSS
jgi:hypothetical protein